MTSKRNSYTAKFKLGVIKFAVENNNCSAARHFNVNEKLVRDWRKQENKIKNMPILKCADRGKKCSWPHLESDLKEWIVEQRNNGFTVTQNVISLKARTMAAEINMPKFTGGISWCTRFLRRNDFVLRQKTKIAQKLPKRLVEKVTQSHSFVIKMRKRKNYDIACIGNMDETPVWFDMPSSRTISEKGKETVFIKTTGHEKTRFTVVFSCMADGTPLKPMVIFKRRTIPKGNFPTNVVLHVHPKGWMGEEGIKLWIC